MESLDTPIGLGGKTYLSNNTSVKGRLNLLHSFRSFLSRLFKGARFHFSVSGVLPSFLLPSYLHISTFTSNNALPQAGTQTTLPPTCNSPFRPLFSRQQKFHLPLTSPHCETTLNYATPNPSIAPCSFTTCPASEYEALQRNLTLLPAPRSTPCTRIVCVMPFCCEGAKERPD
jgi:hypothetical protein